MKNIPEVGKTYNCFDDGKVRKSRLYQVKVKEVLKISEVEKDVVAQWVSEKKSNPWLYAKETDYFIITDNESDTEVFVRTLNGGWFSMGFMNSGRLDIDGTLTEIMNQQEYENNR